MKIVVDSSSFFYGFQLEGGNEYFTTESVLEEIRGRGMRKSIENMMPFLNVSVPSQSSVMKVRRVAKDTGDLDQLSHTDLELIALAEVENATILTNDLAIQNVCRKIGVSYQSFGGKEIKEEIEWKYRCKGCGRVFDKKMAECPYCGSELRKFPRRRKTIT